MPSIPEHIVDQVRDAVNIVDVISRYVTLKKRGRNFTGLCPFHQEKTPSFSVNAEKQIFHCFGCGAGGNVFTFLMRHENLSFVDAVQQLADETGIKIPKSREYKRQETENEQLFKANQIAESFYQRQLQAAPSAVSDYLKKRDLSKQIIDLFKLGYAPNQWDGLLKHVQHFNYSLSPYKKLGLFLESEKSKRTYDRFRNRLMFPIHNQSGKVVAFGGRALGEDKDTPKYINSPESPIYHKGRILYGLYFAREAIREQGAAIFVEGYMDLLQLFQKGIPNVVATSGTALTEEHARVIRRYTDRIYLCYDADSAGVNAAVRGGEVLFQQLIDVMVLILPEGEDPDSYVNTHGKDAFLELLKSAQNYLNFRLAVMKQKYDLQVAGQRSQAVGEILDVLVPLQDNVRIGFYVEKIAENLQLPITMLLNEVQKKQKAFRKRRTVPEKTTEEQPAQKAPLVFTGAWGGEKDIILLLLSYFEEIHQYVQTHITEEDFRNPEFRELFRLIRDHGQSSPHNLLHAVLDNLDNDALRDLILREMEHSNREFQKPALYLQGCIKQIKIARYRAKIDVNRQKLKELPSTDENYLSVLKELQESMNELKKWQDVVCREE